jgi:hypothetical protein
MAQTTYQTVAMSDAELLDRLDRMWNSLGSPADATVTLYLVEAAGNPLTITPGRWRENAALAELDGTATAMMKQAHIIFPSPRADQLRIQRPDAGSRYDVYLNAPNAFGDAVLPFAIAAQREFPMAAADFAAGTLGPAIAEFYDRREADLTRLEELTRGLVKQNVEHRNALDNQAAEERSRLESEALREREKLQSEMAVVEAGLAKRREELEQQLAVLEDRRSTHERRQLRKDLKKTIADRGQSFGLTKETRAMRNPLHALFATLILTTGILTGLSAQHALADSSVAAIIRLSLSALSFIGALAFYIRWNDAWASEHAKEEFRLQRMDLDIDRASWVVEMALEWKEERGDQISPELVERLTQNLFENNEVGSRAVRHPAQDLASLLLGVGTELKIPLVGGGELKLDRKAMKQLTEIDKPT